AKVLIFEQKDSLALEAAREGGKPLVDSQVEVARAIDCIEICIETLRTEAGHVIPMQTNAASAGRLAFTQHEPIGVVVAVSAFNHPINLIAHQVTPAIATGCPVIVKPAEDTPLSCFRLVRIFHEAGLPKAWCQAVYPQDLAVAEQLVTDSRVALFSFIGSSKVGWMLRSKLAPGTRCALEHGGVAPVILAEDADLGIALPSILKGGFYHAGQVCVSVQRVYAQADMAESFAKGLADEASNLIVGDPTLAETEVGPLIRPREVDRIHAWVSEAIKEGATLLTGGKPLSDTTYAPTVLLNPDESSRISREEVFGPVVCIYTVSDMDEAIDRANALSVSFQGAVFTKNIDNALRVFNRLNASAIMVNDHTAFRVDWMPFAGLKTSGHGVGGIAHSMHDMQIEKMMVIRSAEL
ncbi:MAG: aldehyde dehydrogenase family protein, partial [Mariprofundaceae bacterium]